MQNIYLEIKGVNGQSESDQGALGADLLREDHGRAAGRDREVRCRAAAPLREVGRRTANAPRDVRGNVEALREVDAGDEVFYGCHHGGEGCIRCAYTPPVILPV